jgi:hypothetical protein
MERVFLRHLNRLCRPEWKTFIQALELRSQGRKDEQQLVQIPLSKPMMPPTHCRVPYDCLSVFEGP